MTQVVFQPTTSGKTPHQRVEEFVELHLPGEGKALTDYAYLIGVENGTDAYDQAISIILEGIGQTSETLLEYIGLNGN